MGEEKDPKVGLGLGSVSGQDLDEEYPYGQNLGDKYPYREVGTDNPAHVRAFQREGRTNNVNFTVDGIAKTVNAAPTTGSALYAAAGNPAQLKSGGSVIPNNANPVTVSEGQAFTTK